METAHSLIYYDGKRYDNVFIMLLLVLIGAWRVSER